ncbi:MAG: tRNA (cytidine(34)-2'-O)-methyltransferase [Pyrinomonadaceae bacterium]
MHIVLVEPEIPQNTGNIARLCALTESALHLVCKLGFSTSDYYLRRAGLDYWDCLNINYHDSLEALRQIARSSQLFYVSTKARLLYTEVKYHWEDYLVFGSETRGLPSELIHAHPEASIKIPMWGTKPRSHNLSNAAAIVVYEALRQIKEF